MSVDWVQIGVTILSAVGVYAFLVLVLRATGKRTTSKMNSFDWVVTVALGSMVATTILVEEVSFVVGLVGISTLVLVQYVVAWVAARVPSIKNVLKASPRLLYYRGEFLEDVMRRERMTKDEILATLRGQGFSGLQDVMAVVLETNAEVSVVPEDDREDTLHNVDGWEKMSE